MPLKLTDLCLQQITRPWSQPDRLTPKGFFKWLIAFAPAIFWGWLILKLLLLSSGEIPKFPILLSVPHLDKIIHAVLFGVWAATLLWADKRSIQFSGAFWLILSTVFIYGGALELVQEFQIEGRTGTIGDLIADCTGAVIVLLIGRRLI